MSDSELRRAFIELSDSGPVECEQGRRIWDAAAGQLSPAATRELVAHCGECGACAESWRIARRFLDEAGRQEVARNRSVASRGLWTVAAAAAVLAIALTVPIWLPREATGPAATFRDEGSGSISALTDEKTALPRAAVVLRWSAGPAGTLYDLRVATERLGLLTEVRGIETNEYTVPAESLEGLPPGTRLLWQVTARYPDGDRRRSQTFLVSLQ